MTPRDAELANSFRFLTYHHRAMESRRTIGLRVFTGIVVLYLIIAKGSEVYIDKVGSPDDFRFLIQVVTTLIFLTFTFFMIQIEVMSGRDRRKYLAFEKYAYEIFRGDSEAKLHERKESFWARITIAWAATWPIVTLLFFSIGVCKFVGMLKVETAAI